MESDIQLHFDFKDEQRFLKVMRKVLQKSISKRDQYTSLFIETLLDYYSEYEHIEFYEQNLIAIHNAIVDYGGFLNLNFAIKFKTHAVKASRIIARHGSSNPVIVRF